MKIIIAGGSGQVGTVLTRDFIENNHDVVILSRSPRKEERARYRVVQWNAETKGDWMAEVDNSDVVINMVGRNVNCRYTEENRRQIMDSRVKSTKVIGEAISNAGNPPKVWLQASTATIYAHRFDAPNDEITGIIGGGEPGAPKAWDFSISVAKAWEQAANDANTPNTRKVLMRSAVTMSPDRNGIFDVLLGLVNKGLGGTAASGTQYVSWVHDLDFINSIHWLIDHEELEGAINISSPNPLPNAEFMKILREAAGVRISLPATELMLKVGAFFMQTETELILKSRRVVPTRLIDSGFKFKFPDWPAAAADLCARWHKGK